MLAVPAELTNPEAERAVLGACLHSTFGVQNALAILKPEHFFNRKYQKLFGVISDMFLAGRAIDLVTLSEHLSNKGFLDDIGGRLALVQLLEGVASPANVKYHAGIVKEKHLSRELWHTCVNGLLSIKSGTGFAETVSRVGSGLFSIAKEEQGEDELKTDFLGRLERSDSVGIATGFHDLDGILGGFLPGSLNTLAGRPGTGKTSLATDIAIRKAMSGYKVGLYSYEMTKQAIEDRIICNVAKLNTHHIFTRGYSQDDKAEAMRHIHQLKMIEQNLIIIDHRYSPVGFAVNTRLHAQKDEIQLFILDYLQRFSITEDTKDVSYACKVVKDVALELEVPFILLSSLSRNSEYRTDRRPTLSDLRSSGSIEYDSDTVTFLHNPATPLLNKPFGSLTPDEQDLVIKWTGMMEVSVAKNKNGPTGMTRLAFLREHTRFEDLAHRAEVPF